MTNEELYDQLNDETKLLLDGIFSILDYLKIHSEKVELSVKMSEYACFLATLKYDVFTSYFFKKNNVDIEKYSNIYNNFELKKIFDCSSFDSFDLVKFITSIVDDIKDGYYLNLKDINYNDIMPYQIFESILNNSNYLSEWLEQDFKIDNVKKELNTFLFNNYCDFAEKYGIDVREEIKNEIEQTYPSKAFEFDLSEYTEEAEKDYYRDNTPYLDKYGEDLTKSVFIKDPCIGREDAIKKIEQILLVPRKNKSIIIVGESGVGKTALIEGLAYRIQKGLVPKRLKNLRIICINAGDLSAGTQFSGTLEEKINNIFYEASLSKDIIIFMDEIHQAIGAGKTMGNDNSVAELLKKPLQKSRVIGATTTNEYVEYIESNAAFRSKFRKITLSELDKDTIFLILDDLITTYNKMNENGECSRLDLDEETKRRVFDILIDATDSNHAVHDDKVSNPRLSIDILDEAFSIADLDNRDNVTIDDIADALASEERLNPSTRDEHVRRIRMLSNQKETSKKGKVLSLTRRKDSI